MNAEQIYELQAEIARLKSELTNVRQAVREAFDFDSSKLFIPEVRRIAEELMALRQARRQTFYKLASPTSQKRIPVRGAMPKKKPKHTKR